MRRSKLEMCIDVLRVLVQRGPLKLTHIMYKANLNCSILVQYLDFLNQQGLIEERVVGRNMVVYACTARGIRVLKCFKEINQAFSLIEGEDKNLPPAY